jgi:hypothetical protein
VPFPVAQIWSHHDPSKERRSRTVGAVCPACSADDVWSYNFYPTYHRVEYGLSRKGIPPPGAAAFCRQGEAQGAARQLVSARKLTGKHGGSLSDTHYVPTSPGRQCVDSATSIALCKGLPSTRTRALSKLPVNILSSIATSSVVAAFAPTVLSLPLVRWSVVLRSDVCFLLYLGRVLPHELPPGDAAPPSAHGLPVLPAFLAFCSLDRLQADALPLFAFEAVRVTTFIAFDSVRRSFASAFRSL